MCFDRQKQQQHLPFPSWDQWTANGVKFQLGGSAENQQEEELLENFNEF